MTTPETHEKHYPLYEHDNLQDVKRVLAERTREYSELTSGVVRQLAFAGIAISWMFSTRQTQTVSIVAEFLLPLWLFVLTLTFDLLHYLTGYLSFSFRRAMLDEPQLGPVRATISGWIHRYPPTRLLFTAKCVSLLAGYSLTLAAFYHRLMPF